MSLGLVGLSRFWGSQSCSMCRSLGSCRMATDSRTYLVTDIEADGRVPGRNSMISIATVAVGHDGSDRGQFVINLRPVDGLAADPGTMDWWETQPTAWAEATRDPVPAPEAIDAFIGWALALPGPRVFVANPLSFDGAYVGWYLDRFGTMQLFDQPDRRGLTVGGLDLPTLVMGVKGWPFERCHLNFYPAEWLGEHEHSHRAIDDALGYAHLLTMLLREQSAGR